MGKDLSSYSEDFTLNTMSFRPTTQQEWHGLKPGKRNVQQGGAGNDTLKVNLSNHDPYGPTQIKEVGQKGKQGDDKISFDGAVVGNFHVDQDGGDGNDQFSFSAFGKGNKLSINGGTGYDSATINMHGEALTVKDKKGRVLYGDGSGNCVTVKNLEQLFICEKDGKKFSVDFVM